MGTGPVLLLLALGVLAWMLMGIAVPTSAKVPLIGGGVLIAVVVALTAATIVALTGAIRLWADHPQEARLVALATAGLVVVAALIHDRRRRAGGDDDEDGGGGGGERRRPLDGPPSGPPAPGVDPAPDWDGFDRLRRDWERVPSRS